MDFPTALRYLMAGRTIRRASVLAEHFRLGTIHETRAEKDRPNFENKQTIVMVWVNRPKEIPWFAALSGHELLATDWELVE
jgi:hypothetical protein